MKRQIAIGMAAVVWACGPLAAKKKQPASAPQAPLDRYIQEAYARSKDSASNTPGSIWLAGSRLADAARDIRASQVDDVLTVVVAEQASAVIKSGGCWRCVAGRSGMPWVASMAISPCRGAASAQTSSTNAIAGPRCTVGFLSEMQGRLLQ